MADASSRIGTLVAAVMFLLSGCEPTGAQTTDAAASRQLGRLLADRPELARALEHRIRVRNWIERRFEEARPQVVWDPSPPTTGRGGEFDAGDPEMIRLRLSPGASGIDQLSTLIFELHNVMGHQAFNAIHERAVAGLLSREDYARAMLQQEISALGATREFLASNLTTLTPDERRVARRYYRYRYGPITMEERLVEARGRGVDLLDHYRRVFDDVVLGERQAGRRAH